MSDTKLIDLTNFLIHRPEPQNINCVTDNDITISIICALAESKAKRMVYNNLWRRAFTFLKLNKTDENRTEFYNRANAIVKNLTDQGVVKTKLSGVRFCIMLKSGYQSVLQRAISLYNECATDIHTEGEKTGSAKDDALLKKMETIAGGTQVKSQGPEEQTVIKPVVQASTPVMEKAPPEKEPVSVSPGALKIAYLKWLDDQIDYATQKKKDLHLDGRYEASTEWGAAAQAFIDAKNEFSRLFSIKDREYASGDLSQWCSSCDWKGENLRFEITTCPACGKDIDEDCKIIFGGTEIYYRKSRNRFYIRSPFGDKEGVIYDADYKDAMLFILRHSSMPLE
jgi:hypothetical protein